MYMVQAENSSNHKYEGVKLMPSIFSDLLIEKFDGKRFKRKDAIHLIMNYFANQGGLIDGVDGVSVFKRASSKLKNNGLVNPAYGIWQLNYKKAGVKVVEASSTTTNKFNIEIGTGNQSVYVYYFDVYRRLALVNEEKEWSCKIGKTNDSPYFRILNQEKTVFPEEPVLAILIHTNNSTKYECTIHSILDFKGKKMKSPGNEWYMTNIEEILKIVHFMESDNEQ